MPVKTFFFNGKLVYLYPKMCKSCCVQCCRKITGIALLEDFPTRESLTEAFKTGRWTVDYGSLPNGGESPFPRAAAKGFEGMAEHRWPFPAELECTFLGEKGCELKPGDRPAGCRYMIPTTTPCVEPVTYAVAAETWQSRAAELIEASLGVPKVIALGKNPATLPVQKRTKKGAIDCTVVRFPE
jgi:hypothetical protein